MYLVVLLEELLKIVVIIKVYIGGRRPATREMPLV